MFRCPSCGQGKEMYFKGTRGERLHVVMEDDMEKVNHVFYKYTHYREGAEDKFLKMIPKVIGQEIDCPRCPEAHTLEQWLEAKTDTLKYLEMEDGQLCHCGGELWMDQIPGTTQYGFVCEKCEWVKPKKTVSGA